MTAAKPLVLRFWGVRGSVPAPQPENLGFGGNTPCLEVRFRNGPPLIFDSGTGIRRLGLALLEEHSAGRAHLFLTHFHWDHIQGIPFFSPLYSPRWQLTFYSALRPSALQRILDRQMKSPYFSAGSAVRAERRYLQLRSGGVRFGDLRVRPFPLRHPDGAVGYRIDWPRGSIVYASDHEHGSAVHDAALRQHARGADILIYDAQYTPDEYARHEGWGHSTWLEGTRLVRHAQARRLILFHHDPQHDDCAVSDIEAEARTQFRNTIAAREGWSVTL